MTTCMNCGEVMPDGAGMLCRGCIRELELGSLIPCDNCGVLIAEDNPDGLCAECVAQLPEDKPAPFEITASGYQAIAWLYQHDTDTRRFKNMLNGGAQ